MPTVHHSSRESEPMAVRCMRRVLSACAGDETYFSTTVIDILHSYIVLTIHLPLPTPFLYDTAQRRRLSDAHSGSHAPRSEIKETGAYSPRQRVCS